jgi:hypothetical protein
MVAPPILNHQNPGCPAHGLGGELRIREPSILACKVAFDYPTGSRTGFSDIDGNL